MADRKPAAEPTMEEILSSIRRIIAEDEDKTEPEASARGPVNLAGGDEVLDLTEVVPEAETPRPRAVAPAPEAADRSAGAGPPASASPPDPQIAPVKPAAGPAMPPSAAQPPDAAESLISAEAAKASAQALARLARAGSSEERRSLPGGSLPVEQFLSDLMTPLLREWLDRHLPEIVERVVEQEVKRLARRAELL